MDGQTLGAALALMKKMPDNAASSAAAAEASAELAQEYAESVDAATVAETLAYMDEGGSANPADTVTITGKNPVIKAAGNTRYICGELQTLAFTPNPNGISSIRFSSGTTATVLTVPNTVKWPDWFSGTLSASRIYELSILDGVYGVVCSWA